MEIIGTDAQVFEYSIGVQEKASRLLLQFSVTIILFVTNSSDLFNNYAMSYTSLDFNIPHLVHGLYHLHFKMSCKYSE